MKISILQADDDFHPPPAPTLFSCHRFPKTWTARTFSNIQNTIAQLRETLGRKGWGGGMGWESNQEQFSHHTSFYLVLSSKRGRAECQNILIFVRMVIPELTQRAEMDCSLCTAVRLSCKRSAGMQTNFIFRLSPGLLFHVLDVRGSNPSTAKILFF